MPKQLFAIQTGAGRARLQEQPIRAPQQQQRAPKRQAKRGKDHHVESTPQLEEVLDQVCALWGTNDRQAVFERLFEERLKGCFHEMAGLKQGPRLIVDNTKPQGHRR